MQEKDPKSLKKSEKVEKNLQDENKMLGTSNSTKNSVDPSPAMTATGRPTPTGATAKPVGQDGENKGVQKKQNSTEI